VCGINIKCVTAFKELFPYFKEGWFIVNIEDGDTMRRNAHTNTRENADTVNSCHVQAHDQILRDSKHTGSRVLKQS